MIYDIFRDKVLEKRMLVTDAMEIPESLITVKYVRYKRKAPPRKPLHLARYTPPARNSFLQSIRGLFTSTPPPPPIHDGFNASEKVSLRAALQCCVLNSNKAFDSSTTLFEHHLDQVKLWFGSTEPETIKQILNGIYIMNKVLSDSTRILTYVDMRHQRDHHIFYSPLLEPAVGLSTCYGKSSMDFISEKYPPNPNMPDGLEVPGHLPADGIRILIGEHMLQPTQTVENRALIIYHEMTHRLLNTRHRGFEFLSTEKRGVMPIFGAKAAQQAALEDPAMALITADCWSYFVASFAKNAPTQ